MTCVLRSIALVVACALTTIVAGCGNGDDPAVTVSQSAQPSADKQAAPSAQTPPSAPAAQPSAPAAAAPESAEPGGAAASADAAAPQQPASGSAQPIAVEDHEVSGIQVALMDLRRTSGDTVTLRLQFRNTTDSDANNSLFYGNSIATGTYLIDGASKKKYLVVRDANNAPVGYVGQSGTIKARATLPAWAKFPAPPAGINTVTVVVPGAPPFEDVPIK